MNGRTRAILTSTPTTMLATAAAIVVAMLLRETTELRLLPVTFLMAPLAATALGPRQAIGSVSLVVTILVSFVIFPGLLPGFIPESQLASVRSMLLATCLSLVVTVVVINHFRRRLHRLLKRMSIEARIDMLTGASNRRHGHELLANELDRSLRLGHSASIILFDIDHFKRVNDRYGHNMGDTVLIELAELTRQELRSYDTLIRWGGEEFLVLLPETDLETAAKVAERLRRKVWQHRFAHGQTLTVSAGVASAHAVDSPDTFLARADALLYRTKGAGRNQIAAVASGESERPARHLN